VNPEHLDLSLTPDPPAAEYLKPYLMTEQMIYNYETMYRMTGLGGTA